MDWPTREPDFTVKNWSFFVAEGVQYYWKDDTWFYFKDIDGELWWYKQYQDKWSMYGGSLNAHKKVASAYRKWINDTFNKAIEMELISEKEES